MKNLIAFTGIAGCGKSTAAHAITQHCQACRMSFADPIRSMLKALGLTHAQLTIDKQHPIAWLDGKTPRYLMQMLGTEWGRHMIHPNIWVMLAQKRIEQHRENSDRPIAFDDCRFDNEARLIRGMGGVVVELRRDALQKMAHASEKGVSASLVDKLIVNTTDSRDGFQKLVVEMCGRL